MPASDNCLYYGDNLTIMKGMPSDSIDLIYLDPPFNSKRTYNLIYKNATGRPIPEQVEAFCDSWDMDAEKEEIVRNLPALLDQYGMGNMIGFWDAWISSLRQSQPKLLAYLVYMAIRLFEMRRILKPTGSLYLHCDPTASHYIKVILDSIFGHENFRNEIIWGYKTGGRSTKSFPKKHDTIFWYSKTKEYIFNYNDVSLQRDFSTMHESVFKDKDGRLYQRNIKNGKEYRYYLDKGVLPNDYWVDIQALNPSDKKERLGYPTQKPLKLLDRIIKASCPKGGIIFDPFCGCGTSIYAAQLNKRQWIGCDITILSVNLIRDVLFKRYGLLKGKNFQVNGIPNSIESAKVLSKHDPHQFQNWLIELAGGFCNKKKAHDKGVDGRLYFEADSKLKTMVLSVKGGATLTPAYIRELRGTLENEINCEMGGFLCLNEATKGMHAAASKAGLWTYKGVKYPKLQILTVGDLLGGKRFNTPSKIQTMDTERQGILPGIYSGSASN